MQYSVILAHKQILYRQPVSSGGVEIIRKVFLWFCVKLGVSKVLKLFVIQSVREESR